ncbi:MAG: flagellar brake protein [Herbaspirillum sp.]|jgi:c-di-GMP-binding flagellar brake protein YcgR|nr:flagellar brake protein [Herbaspirillum sp.]
MPNNDEIADDNPYRVSSRREIVMLLNSMMKRSQLFSLTINSGSESAITSILDVDDDSNTMILDAAPSAILNAHILESNKIAFEALYNNIRITFNVSGADGIDFQDRPALRVDIPDSLVRLQRREYFRIATPIAKPIKCTVNMTREDGNVIPVVTMLYNISVGGLGLTDGKCLLDGNLGHIFDNCKLDLTENTVIPLKLTVRDFKEIKLVNGKTVRRLGCEFVDIQRASLAAIQRFITKIEREQNAKAAGMK